MTESFTANGLEEQEARDKAYITTLPKFRKDSQSIYLDRLLWIAQMKKDPVHKQIMKTHCSVFGCGSSNLTKLSNSPSSQYVHRRTKK